MAKKATKKTVSSVSTDVEMEQVDLPVEETREELISNEPTAQTAVLDHSVTPQEDEVEQVVERRSKRPRTGSAEKVQRPQRHAPEEKKSCQACHSDAVPSSLQLLVCSSCALCIHASCYTGNTSTTVQDDPAAWICDVCRHPADTMPVAARTCIYCKQPGSSAMRRVETSHWPAVYREGAPAESTAWGHLDCALWDPFGAEPKLKQLDEQSSATSAADRTVEDPASDVIMAEEPPAKSSSSEQTARLSSAPSRLELPVPACCFCEKDHGVRVQCRQLECGRFFHVRCAGDSNYSGYVEVAHAPFPLKHAYCDRHNQCRYNVGALAIKLTSKTMASLVPRDVAQKVAALAKRIESYVSLDAAFIDLTKLLVDQCNKGLKNSKNDPPTFSMRQLQALQLVLDHLPQLRNVYDASTLSVTESELIQDTELVHALHKAFHPQRFVRKFAGPLSQHLQCDLCHEPFQERQHVFYCTSSDQPHALHWKCTKRKANAKESRQGNSGSTKKKLKSVPLVQQGHWKDVKLPKGLPNVSDGVACGVCRAPVDARGIIAGRKDATRIEFEKPTSDFMFGGCFANEMDVRTAAAAGLRTSRASASSTAVVVAASNVQKVSAKSAVRRSASGSVSAALNESEGDASLVLAPPKMERINVRRTTRWLACLGEVIRQVLAAKKEAALKAKAVETASTSEEGVVSEPGTNVSGAEAETSPVSHDAASQPDGVDGSVTTSEAEATTVREPEEEAVSNAEASAAKDLGRPELRASEGNATTEGGDVPMGESHVKEERIADGAPPAVDAGETANATVDAVEDPSTLLPSSLPPAALAYLEEAKNVVRPYDAYALHKMETAHSMLDNRNGPALSVLNTLVQEYTRFVYIKHTRAVAKATNEKRKRLAQEALEERERERKRIDQEAEMALKKQMLAMRKKQQRQ